MFQCCFVSQVGMSRSPTIPEWLSREGKDFLSRCLEHDSKKRATTENLLSQLFLKVF